MRMIATLKVAALAALMGMGFQAVTAAKGQVPTHTIDPLDALAGRALFERNWTIAPASTDAADGLGPLFNARACSACHPQGKGARFDTQGRLAPARGVVVRVATQDGSSHPELGEQLQDHGVPGVVPEGRVEVRLVNARLEVETSLSTPISTPAVFEVRVAPSLRGKSLLDLVDENAVLALADPEDRDGDGISGRPRMLSGADGALRIGRYGSKASGGSLVEQTAIAAALDIGLSSPFVRRPHGDCTSAQAVCLSRPTGRSRQFEGEEVSLRAIQSITAYIETLEAPRTDLRSLGFELFTNLGCATCHVPKMPARNGKFVQVFTDLLLHDLGPANASVIGESDTTPTEWRTAPLHDLDPSGGTRRYMHGGQAANITEAIMLHGGEAADATRAFLERDGHEQHVLIDFLSRL